MNTEAVQLGAERAVRELAFRRAGARAHGQQQERHPGRPHRFSLGQQPHRRRRPNAGPPPLYVTVMFYDRKHGPDRWLTLKMALVGLAAAAFLFGVRLDLTWPVWVAVGLLVVGFALRFLRHEPQDEDAADS